MTLSLAILARWSRVLASVAASLSLLACAPGSQLQGPLSSLPPALATPPSLNSRPSRGISFARIDATPGKTLVLIFESSSATIAAFPIKLADGRPLKAQVFRLGLRRDPAPPAPSADGWLTAPLLWTAQPAAEKASEAFDASLYAAMVEIPADAVGTTIWINGHATPLNLLVDSSSLVPSAQWRPLLPAEAAGNEPLLTRLRTLAASPLDRWRVRLLIDGMGEVTGPASFDHPLLEAMARQMESRWRLALARLTLANNTLATRVIKRLCAVVRFAPDTFAPAWATSADSLDRLLADLLDPTVKVGVLQTRAEQWLSEQPQGAIWVVDDGGTLEANRPLPIPFIGITNLADRAMMTYANVGVGLPQTPDLIPVGALSTVIVVPQRADRSDDSRPDIEEAVINLGKWVASIPVAASAQKVVPPSLTFSDFVPDLDLDGWLYGRTSRLAPGWETRIMLYKAAPARIDESAVVSTASSTPSDGAWELFITARIGSRTADLTRESITMYLGAAAAPSLVLRVDANGTLTRPDLPGDVTGPLPRIAIVKNADAWSVRVPLPPEFIERGGVGRIGLVRSDALGCRSAWPRAMLPWQAQPARALFDLSAWRGLGR